MSEIPELELPGPNLKAGLFAPAHDMTWFVKSTFLDPDSPLHIPEHAPLGEALIGYQWAWPEARDRNRDIIGMAQLSRPPQSKWSSQRAAWITEQWFGPIDFLITLSAAFWTDPLTVDVERLALLDHELCHCVQATDDFGMPMFNERTGRPIWAMKGHDVEQHVGVVERWGAAAAGVQELVEAASRPARFASVDLTRILRGCGTC